MRPLAVCLVLAGAPAALAEDGLRCGQWLVTAGAGEAEVAARCGMPTDAATQHHRWRVRGGAVLRCTIDIWTYDRGPTEFVRTLTFTDGILERVSVGDYGRR